MPYFSPEDVELCQCFNVDIGTMIINDKLATGECITNEDVNLIGHDLWHFEQVNRSGENSQAMTRKQRNQARKVEQSERAAKMAKLNLNWAAMEANGLSVTDFLEEAKYAKV